MTARKRPNPEEAFNQIINLNCDGAEIQLCLASIEKDDADVPNFEKMQLHKDVASSFLEIVRKNIRKMQKTVQAGDIRLLKYDAGAMNRDDEIEYLDYAEEADIASQIAGMDSIAKLPVFSADNEFVNRLRFYGLAVFSKTGAMLFLRLYTPKNELTRSSYFGIRLAGKIYDKIQEPIFLFDYYIDCIVSDGYIFILSKDRFQKIFRYFEKMRTAGREALKAIYERVKIENFDALSKLCEGHLLKMAKLKNIASKPYLETVTMADIKRVITEFRLPAKIVQNGDEERLLFDPESKDKWLILRILDDDYLGSIMTKQKYEANSKRPV